MSIKFKRIINLVFVVTIFVAFSMPVFSEDDFGINNEENEIILSKPGDVIVKDNGKSMDQILMESKQKKLTENNIVIRPFPIITHRYSIYNVSQPTQLNLFNPLSEFVENRYYKNSSDWPSVTVSKGTSTTVAISVNTSVGVTADVVSAGLGINVSGSTTLSTSQSYSYKVGYGQRGRVIMRYSRKYYTFKCKNETLLNGKITQTTTGPGDAMSKPYNSYVAYQYYQIW